MRLTLGRLSAAFELACQDNRLSSNPCRYVRLPSQEKREGTTWSEDQLCRFLAAAAQDRLHASWRLTVLGERRSEVLGGRWADWDRAAGTITIGRARVLVNARVIEKAPKSERGYRTLPLDAATTAALEALQARQMDEMAEAVPPTPTPGTSAPTSWASRCTRSGTPTSSAGCAGRPGCRSSGCMTPGIPSTR